MKDVCLGGGFEVRTDESGQLFRAHGRHGQGVQERGGFIIGAA